MRFFSCHSCRATPRKRRSRSVESLEQRRLLAANLTTYWLADSLMADVAVGGSATEWTDSVAGLKSTAVGSPTLTTNQLGGRALVEFRSSDGADSFTVHSDVNPLSRVEDFSVVVAFRTDAQDFVGDNQQWFQNTGIVDANQMGFGQDWGLSINAAGQIATGMGDGLGNPPATIYSTATGVNDGQLHVAIVTRSGGTLSLAIDDQAPDTLSDASAAARSNLKLTIGALTDEKLPFTGEIGQVRFYDAALTQDESAAIRAEINAYYGNEAPRASDDSYVLDEDSGLFLVTATDGVLSNDSDVDGDSLAARIVQAPKAGTVSLAEDGSFIYSARRDFFGTDSFTYTANDHRASQEATVTLNVMPVYDAPVPAADAYKIRPGETLTIPALVGLLSNDQNPDDAELEVSLARAVNAGDLTLNSDGSFVYAPNDFAGIASFAYRIDDGTGVTGPVEVIIGVNTPPIAVDDSYPVTEDQSLSVDISTGILANDQDAQADNPLTVTLLTPPNHGTLELMPDGSFNYVPNVEFSGVDSFTYRVSDGFANSQAATVTLSVEAVDDPPEAVADAYFTLPGQSLQVAADIGLLANDSDVEGQPLTARVLSAPTSGTVEIQPDGSFVYQPNVGFAGRDTFSYVARDATSDSAATDVTIDIAGQPLLINELLAINSQTLPTRLRESPEGRFRGDDLFLDWIELQNVLDVDLNIAGIHLTDDPDNLTKWQFPQGTVIPAGEFLVVFASGRNIVQTSLDELGFLHTNFQISSEGEYLALTTQQGMVIDAYEDTPQQYANASYGRHGAELSYFATATPGTANEEARTGRGNEVTVSPGHGFYDRPIEITLASEDPSSTIRYTLDGSEPTAASGIDYTGPITLQATTTLRAVALNDSQLPGPVATTTYLFLEDVIRQSADGSAPEGWPARPVRGQVFDYGMDPQIVDDPMWSPHLRDALTQVPTLSVVLDQDDLTDSRAGIYVNASRDGRAWERPASVELVYPDGTEGFQIDAGLRIRGGFSRGGFNPKHSFRLFFRNEYEGPLNYALFEDEGASQFQAVDLRTAQNYAWSNDTFNDQTRNSFLRDIYSRDLQRELGQPYTRGRYYHLYLNGQYWGLYQTEERPEASFAETYLGGNEGDYDVIKASGGTLEATDGQLQPWRDLWAIANEGFDSLDNYFLIQGKDPNGDDNPNLEVHVQIDNVIDFAINFMFTGNQDMPTSLGNNVANNFWAIRNPNSRDGWQFIAHDNEHNMLSVNEDQTRDDPAGRSVNSFNPKYLHQQLDELPEYRLRFADRIQKHFFNDGPLTRDNARKLLQTRVDQIDQAIIAESARWGDQHNEPALDKNTWLAEVDWLLNDFLGNRTEVVLNQFRRRGLYPDVEAAELNQHGGLVDVGFQLGLTAPAGRIYYTLDGQDPREIGGAISPQARIWSADSEVVLATDTNVMARVWTGTDWSALTEAQFLVGEAVKPTALRISEIHYHPAEPTEAERLAGFDNDDDFEFIELINPSDQTLDLTQAELVRVIQADRSVGVEFDFARGDIVRLGPGETVILVEDRAAFEFRYGKDLPVAGQWSGGLSNAGELLTMVVAGELLQQFAYDDAWHPITDGPGRSLEIINFASPDPNSWAVGTSWQPSAVDGGSPGRSTQMLGDSNGDGIFDSSDLVTVFRAGKYEDSIVDNATFVEGDWNGDGDFDSGDLVAAFQNGNYVGAATSHDIAAAIDWLFSQSLRNIDHSF